jgi:hypothetical protein
MNNLKPPAPDIPEQWESIKPEFDIRREEGSQPRTQRLHSHAILTGREEATDEHKSVNNE